MDCKKPSGDNCRIYSNTQTISWIQGVFISAVLYGAISALLVVNINLLHKRAVFEKHKYGRLGTQTTWLIVYVCGVFTLCSGFIAVQLEESFPGVDVRPTTWIALKTHDTLDGTPQSIFGVACFALIHWAVTLLLIWRLYVIYRNAKTSMRLLLSFASFVLLATVVIGVVFLVIVIKKNVSILPQMLIVYGATCLTSNLLLTVMIGLRLYLFRRHITKIVGRKYAGHYTSVFSMFIESGTIMNIILALAIAELIMTSSLIILQLLNYPLIEALVSFIIVFRVANGTAWATGTANELIAQHRAVGGTTLIPGEMLSGMRYRATLQTSQVSTGFNFGCETGSMNILSSEQGTRSVPLSDAHHLHP